MAKDFQLKHKCPHFVVEEWLAVENDRRTLLPLRNPSSKNITVKKNGKVIPKEGLVSRVSFSSMKQQPFSIEKGFNDKIKFTINKGPLQVITIPSGLRVKSSAIVEAFNEQSSGIRVEEINGRIRIETKEAGPQATLFLKKGSGHDAIGIPYHRFYKGREVVPSWGVVREDLQFENGVRKKIYFENPLKTTDDIFEVSYHTRRVDCRRCAGIGIENDIRYDVFGDPKMVRGIDLLIQEVDKIVFTIQGSNVFYSWYGTSIADMVGEKIIGGGRAIEAQLVSEIGVALDRYRDVKIQQSKLQPIGDQEFLMRVKNIQVSQDRVDPTIFRIRVDLQNRSNEVDKIEKTLIVNTTDGFEQRR